MGKPDLYRKPEQARESDDTLMLSQVSDKSDPCRIIVLPCEQTSQCRPQHQLHLPYRSKHWARKCSNFFVMIMIIILVASCYLAFPQLAFQTSHSPVIQSNPTFPLNTLACDILYDWSLYIVDIALTRLYLAIRIVYLLSVEFGKALLARTCCWIGRRP